MQVTGCRVGMGPSQHRHLEHFLQVPKGLSQPLVNVLEFFFGGTARGFDGEDSGSSDTPATGVVMVGQEQFSQLF